MSDTTDFKEIAFREEEEEDQDQRQHHPGRLRDSQGSSDKDIQQNHHQQHTYHNFNTVYGKHHSLTPPEDEEEDEDDDTSEEIFGVPRTILQRIPLPSVPVTSSSTSSSSTTTTTATTKNLIANPFKTDSPTLEYRSFASSLDNNQSSSSINQQKYPHQQQQTVSSCISSSSSKMKAMSYALDTKGSGVCSTLSEPESSLENEVDHQQHHSVHSASGTSSRTSPVSHMTKSPSMPEPSLGRGRTVTSSTSDPHHHPHPGLTRGHSIAASSVAASHPLVQVIRDSVYSSLLYNKQRFQEKLLPLLPFPSSSSSSTGSNTTPSAGRPPFLLKSADPVLEARILALKHSRSHLKQILRVTQGPVISSLNALSSSFSQLNLLLNDLNTSRVDFSSSGSHSSDALPVSSTYVGVKGGMSSGRSRGGCSESEQQLRDLTATLRSLSQEAEKMKAGIEFLNANLDTLVRKSMQDTLNTCSMLEVSRIEFDAERNYLLSLQTPSATPTASGPLPRVTRPSSATSEPDVREEKSRSRVQVLEQKYQTLKSDVAIKMDFLNANKEKVMNKSLSLMHSLLGSFFHPLPVTNGARTKLDAVLKAYSVKNPISSPVSSSSFDVAKTNSTS